MIVRMTSGSLGLLAFSAAIMAGLWAGNDMTTILRRAWWALILFVVLGAVLGWLAQIAINEYLEMQSKQEDAAAADDMKPASAADGGKK